MEEPRDRRNYLGTRGGNEKNLPTDFSWYVELRDRSSLKEGRNV